MTIEETLERLGAAGIDLLPLSGMERHFVCHRGGFVALVERTPEGFGAIGSSGLITGKGFAALVWRAGKPFFVTKGYEQPASQAEVEALRSFASGLETALQ
jgi:hypothetical protein